MLSTFLAPPLSRMHAKDSILMDLNCALFSSTRLY